MNLRQPTRLGCSLRKVCENHVAKTSPVIVFVPGISRRLSGYAGTSVLINGDSSTCAGIWQKRLAITQRAHAIATG